jgi:ACS family glucarate transporter-like MFS transporter
MVTSGTPPDSPAPCEPVASRVRYLILATLFVVTTVNYADRAALSIAGPTAAKQLGLGPVAFGYILSAFGWAYVIGQIPGGWLLDRFGSTRVYTLSIFAWSIFTMLQGFAGAFRPGIAVVILFVLVFLMGLAEAPSFPGNGRIVAAWFPARERGTASAVFNAAQYSATVVFAPLSGWITQALGWPYVFVVLGSLGVLLTPVFWKTVRSPAEHSGANRAELDYIARGGGLVSMDQPTQIRAAPTGSTWGALRQLLTNRTLLGVYIGQYCITTLTYFFLTWFPVYLIAGRGLTSLKAGLGASLPALFGFCGGILGGVFSDHLLKKGWSLTAARKTPIVAGMLLSASMIACNYVDAVWAVLAIMCVAFFGKGIGALGWAVVSDTSPKERAGLCGSLFNTFGNTAAITTPIVIGYIVQWTGSFNGALVFVAANAVMAIVCYLIVVGDITRVGLGPAG